MPSEARLRPIDPTRHRAHIREIYATLPNRLQHDALGLVEHWPRLIHALAREGQLEAPLFAAQGYAGERP